MRCPSCGREVSGESFCEWCGKPLKAEAPPPTELKSATPSADKPSSPVPSMEESGAALQGIPSARTKEKADNAGSQPRWYPIAWAGLAIVLYLAIADAAVETFLRESPLRWWISGAAVLYLALCVAVWRLMPKLWRRLNWANQAALSLLVLFALMSATAWVPGGLEQGLTLAGHPASALLAIMSAAVIVFSAVFLSRLRFLPRAVKIVAGVLASYGATAFLLAVTAGTSFPFLFHGQSQWTKLPFFLQGAPVASLTVLPLAIVAGVMSNLARFRTERGASVGTVLFLVTLCIMTAITAFRGFSDASEFESGRASTTMPGVSASALAQMPPEQKQELYQKRVEALDGWVSSIENNVNQDPATNTDVAALAHSLSGPQAAFEYVRDNIALEPYPGVLKGAVATLVTRGGNDMDRALLLAAILAEQGAGDLQIAHGQLSPKQASTLLQQITATPDAIDRIATSLPESVPTPSSDDLRERVLKQTATIPQAIERNYQLLRSSLKAAGISIRVEGDDKKIRALQDHYWVRFQQDGKTVELDPSFSTAGFGQGFTSTSDTFTPDATQGELFQKISFRISADYLQGGKPHSEEVLRSDFKAIDLFGKNIRLGLLPTDNSANEFEPTLSVDDQTTPGQKIELAGESKEAQTKSPLVDSGGGLLGGLAGGMKQAPGAAGFGPAESPEAKSSKGVLARVYVDAFTDAPGLPSSRSRRVIMDRLTRNRDGVGIDPTMTADLVRRLLLQVWDGAIAVGPVHPDYLLRAATVPWLHAYSDELKHVLAARYLGQKIELSNLRGPGLSPQLLSFALASSLAEHSLQRGLPGVRAYYERPRILFLRHGFGIADWSESPRVATYREGIDLANSPFAFLGSQESATSLAMRWGIADTALELGVNLAQPSSLNALPLVSAALSRGTPVNAFSSDQKSDLNPISVPSAIKAVLQDDMSGGGTLIAPLSLVPISGKQTYGWWSIQPGGYALGRMELGGGQAMSERQIVEVNNDINETIINLNAHVVACGFAASADVLAGAESADTGSCVEKAVCEAYSELLYAQAYFLFMPVGGEEAEKGIQKIINELIKKAGGKLAAAGCD